MLFRKHIVSSRTLIQLTVALVFFMVAAVGAAVAANSGNPPLLVPTQLVTVAGISQYNASNAQVGGFSGDGTTATETLGSGTLGKKGATAAGGAALNSPSDIAVDAVGNIYIADTNNDVLREVNSSTGIINTIAGVPPTGCSGTVCSVHYSGCSNGVPAYGTPIGGTPYAIAVDNFENVYYADYKGTVSIIYRGGTRVADFITRVNPSGVAKAGGVKVGYIYFIAGTINTTNCAITLSPIVNNGPAFTDSSNPNAVQGVTANNIDFISLDAAGNIYMSMGNDASNATTTTAWSVVINTQETPQTFFQYTVQPGYMRQFVNCNTATTAPCQPIVSPPVGVGANAPINGLTFGGGQYIGGSVDGYGNFYQNMGSGSGTGTPSAGYSPIAYAGGPGMTNYLTSQSAIQAAAGYSPTETIVPVPAADTLIPSMLPLTYGNAYHVTVNGDIRPDYWDSDMYGTVYFMDSNQPLLERLDQFQGDYIVLANASALSGRPTTVPALGNNVSNLNGTISDYTSVASFANPYGCIWGNTTSGGGPWIQGPQSYDPFGDNCYGLNVNVATNLRFNFASDSIPNLIFPDYSRQRVRKLNVGTQFPESTNPYSASVPVGSSLTQWVQIHFDSSNPPLTGAGAASGSFTSQNVQVPTPNLAYTTNAITVAPNAGDFSIDVTTPEFPMDANTQRDYGDSTNNGLAMWAGLPTCSQLNLSALAGINIAPDTSYDCMAYVKFAPTQPGLRTGTMVVTTANGSVYNFQLTGMATAPQLAIDGGQQTAVTATGLGTTSSVAVSPNGTIYIADPTNNRIVVNTAGVQTVIGPTLTVQLPSTFVGTPVQTLSNPQGVALDAAGNIYISDTGNTRVLEYNPNTQIATILGNYVWVPGAACDGGTTSPTINVNCNFTNYTSNTIASAKTQNITNEIGAAVVPTVAPPQYKWGKPLGLAVDAWGNVFVADAGNASATPAIPPAVVEIPANIDLGGATPLLQYPGAPTFTNPVAVAVDSKGFIYVADTQNVAGEVTRIPPGGGDLQPAGSTFPGSALNVVSALPLFGGQGINNPNGVAVDAAGDVFISDASGNAVWEAPAAGPPNGNPFVLSFSGLSSPAGLALDANGNLYVADSGNKQILNMNRQNPVAQFGTVPEVLGTPSGLAGTPVGCPTTGGSVACTGVLTVTNTGNQPITLTAPLLGLISNPQFTITTTCSTTTPMPVGTTCTIKPLFTPVSTGAATATVTFNASGATNNSQSIALMANGALPEVKIVLTPSNGTGTSPNYAATAAAETIIATVTQPHTSTPTPTGTVVFSYTINPTGPTANGGVSCGASVSSTAIPLAAGVATYAMPTLSAGLVYTVTAVFTPGGADTTDSITNAQTPILLTVAPTVAEAVTAASVTYQYGNAVPTLTGTLNPALPTGVTATFYSGASQYSNVGTYPIQVVFSGTNACSYGFPVAYSSGTTPATVTETKAPLSVLVPAYSTVYGAASFNYATGMVITGAVGTDLPKLSATFTPADSSILNVNGGTAYPVVATMTGKPIGNYTLTITNGTDTVTPAPTSVGITPAKITAASSSLGIGSESVVLNTPAGIAAGTYAISVGSLVTAGKGVPTGTVLVYDTFVPITPTVFIATPLLGVFPTVNGAIQWPSSSVMPCAVGAAASASCTPVVSVPLVGANATFALPTYTSGVASPYYTSSGGVVPGTHYLSFLYSGDAGTNGDGLGDFSCSVFGQASTALPSSLAGTAAQTCPSGSAVPYALVVDNPDYTFTSNTSPISVLPGNVPNGNGLPSQPGQNSSNSQSTIIEIGAINGFIGTVNLTCAPQNPTYVNCFIGQITVVNGAPSLIPYAVVTLAAPAVPAVFDVSTPATLPIGFTFTSQLRTTATRTVLAFLPLGLLAFCVRRRRRLSKALWMLIAIAAVGTVMSGCGGGTNVEFFTPVPTGPQTVTVNATYTSITPSQPTTTRSFVVPITIN